MKGYIGGMQRWLPGIETTEVEAHILLVCYRSSMAGCPQAVQNSAHDFSVNATLTVAALAVGYLW